MTKLPAGAGNVVEPQSLWIIETKHKIVKRLAKDRDLKTNSKYGRFIVQTNEVQLLLGLQILSRSPNPNDELKRNLERLTLGSLINTFRICAYATPDEERILNLLVKYNEARNALAHKMFTDKKLTPRECESIIKKGAQIIQYLKKSMKDMLQQLTVKNSDKLSEFPKQFNKLVRLVKTLEKRIAKLEKRLGRR